MCNIKLLLTLTLKNYKSIIKAVLVISLPKRHNSIEKSMPCEVYWHAKTIDSWQYYRA